MEQARRKTCTTIMRTRARVLGGEAISAEEQAKTLRATVAVGAGGDVARATELLQDFLGEENGRVFEPDVCTPDLGPALLYAVQLRSAEMCAALIAAGARVSTRQHGHLSPLEAAAEAKAWDVFQVLHAQAARLEASRAKVARVATIVRGAQSSPASSR